MPSESNIPCDMCAYDPSLVATWTRTIKVPFEWKSGNDITSNTRGASGSKYRRYRTSFQKVLSGKALSVKKAKCFRRVVLTRHRGYRKREYDSDNLLAGAKPLRDVLTVLGLITGDDPTRARFFYTEEKSLDGNDYVEITLEEFATNE
jgi:hypothetical protein